MGIEMVEKTLAGMARTGHPYTEGERHFAAGFAYRSGDAELTDKLVSELADISGAMESDLIIGRFSALHGQNPRWLGAAEDLVAAIEILRYEEEARLDRLMERFGAMDHDIDEKGVTRQQAGGHGEMGREQMSI